MKFLPEEIDAYSRQHSTVQSDLLARLARETELKVLRPRMLSGPMQGKLLAMYVHMMQAKEILEIGTYTGYSALAMAETLPADGMIHTIDINIELEDMIRKYINEAGMDNQIQLYIGNALEIVPTIDRTFDLVFIDADKENYKAYLDMVIPKCRKGAMIIADNVLWSGKVTQEVKAKDKETKALIEFNAYANQHPLLDNLLLPFRDGLMMMTVK